MKQVTLCIFGDGYNEPNNCEIDLAPEERTLIPDIGDAIQLPGMKTVQIVRSRNFYYSEGRILIIFNWQQDHPRVSQSSVHGTVEKE